MVDSYRDRGGSRSTPVHYYIDNHPYFITAATYKHQRLLADELKPKLFNTLQDTLHEHGWSLNHWVILDDHYHIMAHSKRGSDLPRIMAKAHHLCARMINLHFPPNRRLYRKVWHNYWDYCPRSENDYYVRLCYLLNNPVKHGYVTNLREWNWSSFHRLFAEQGESALRDLFRLHREHKHLNLPED